VNCQSFWLYVKWVSHTHIHIQIHAAQTETLTAMDTDRPADAPKKCVYVSVGEKEEPA